MSDTQRTSRAELDVRCDMLDFPTVWKIQNDRGEQLDHDPRCSSVLGWSAISGPGFLCDCGAVEREWGRLCELASTEGEQP